MERGIRRNIIADDIVETLNDAARRTAGPGEVVEL